ncbi:hypothetical protein MMC26_000430 [Xylographa opegraphella]|nr:hypothetical protein [Xylographa opegraphella]
MAAVQAPGLHFVVSTDAKKPNPELRKFIRSHCMLGKNRGKTLPLRKKKPRRTQDASNPSESPASSTTTTVSRHILPVTVPRKFGSDLSTIRFADAVEPAAVEVVLQFSSIAKKILFPLETCIFFERRAEAWIAPLAFDPAYLHAMIFTSQYFFDAILPQNISPFNQRSLPHFLETVKLLRERLAHGNDEARLSYTTAAAVMGLTGHALWTGNSESARHHMEGLSRIVSLRGGVATFKENPKLLIEILRCDMGIALHSGSTPFFFNNFSSQEPYPPYPNLKLLLELRGPVVTSSQYQSARLFDDMADDLAGIWKIMSEFCSVINFVADSGQCISVDTLLETVASVMYRLFGMTFGADSSDEAIRLGLLAFSCSVFLQWQHLGMSYPLLTSAFRNCLTTLNSQQMSPHLVLWLLMIGAALVFDATDDWWLKPVLLVSMNLCEIRSWSEMQHLLKSSMWIGLIHDKPARRVFDSTTAYPHSPKPDVCPVPIATSSTSHLSSSKSQEE